MESRLQVLHHPASGVEVVDDLNGTLDDSVCLVKLAHAYDLCSAVLGAWRRRPDDVKVSRRVSAVVPVHDVAADVRWRVPIKGDHTAAQPLTDIADRPSAAE